MILNDTANFIWNHAQDMPSESMGEHNKKIVPYSNLLSQFEPQLAVENSVYNWKC